MIASKAFKVSDDIRIKEKLTDIVGLYVSPPERAVMLCCDEKSQVAKHWTAHSQG